MKKISTRIILMMICLSLCALLVGCASSEMNLESNSNYEKNSSQEDSVLNTPQYNRIFSNEVIFYWLERDAFENFVVNPSYDFLKSNNMSVFRYTEESQYFFPSFKVTSELIDFWGNQDEVKAFLANNGVSKHVQAMAILDAPNVPKTVWVSTESDNVFVTINEEYEDEPYTYRVYGQQEFSNRYKGKAANLIVNGKKISSEVTPKYYYDYADVPFIATVRAYGAEITEQETDKLKIVINGKTFTLDKSVPALYQVGVKGREELNLFNIYGGYQFVQTVNSEVMLDSATLNSALYNMGIKITVKYDAGNGNIIIENRK